MAVMIKDIEMPKSCKDCEYWSFNRNDEPICDITYSYISQFDKRTDDCPLKEVNNNEVLDKCFDCGVNLLAKNKTNSVLEDIKAKMDNYENEQKSLMFGIGDASFGMDMTLNYVRDIIDKYKAEERK